MKSNAATERFRAAFLFSAGAKMRILLVEDEKPFSRAICASLAREAFTVDPVYTGPDGLEAAKTGEYDAVILDVMLPGMDGFTVLEHLRAGAFLRRF